MFFGIFEMAFVVLPKLQVYGTRVGELFFNLHNVLHFQSRLE
jgi:hypothetical protein